MKSRIGGARVLILVGSILLIAPWLLNVKHDSTAIRKRTGGSIVFPIPDKITTLEPARVTSALEKGILTLLYARLVRVDENMEIQPDLLESWEYDPQEKQYLFTIKSNARFSDGTQIEAKDVIFSFHQWARNESLDSILLDAVWGVKEYRLGQAESIAGLSEVDKNHVKVKMSETNDSFIYNLSLSRFSIYPNQFRGKPRDVFFERPIGSGPFINLVEVSKSDGSLLFSRNDYYFRGIPLLDRIILRQMKRSDVVASLINRSIDNMIFYENGNALRQDVLRSLPQGIRQVAINSFDIETMIFNASAEPRLADMGRRKAIISHLSKKKIIEECFYNQGQAVDGLIPSGIIGSEMVDKVAQKQISEKSNTRLGLTLYVESEEHADCLVPMLNTFLSESGVVAKTSTFQNLYAMFAANRLGLWIEPFVFKNEDAYSVLQYFNQSSSEYLLGKKYPQLQSIYNRLSSVRTIEEKTYLYKEIESYLIDNFLIAPLARLPSKAYISEKIVGIKFAGSRYNVVDWQDIGLKQ